MRNLSFSRRCNRIRGFLGCCAM